jgi:hypothetical protein
MGGRLMKNLGMRYSLHANDEVFLPHETRSRRRLDADKR